MSAGCRRSSFCVSCGPVLPGDQAFDDLAAALVVSRLRVLQLLVDQALDQPVLAQEHGNFRERVLHAFACFGALDYLLGNRLGHGFGACMRVRRAQTLRRSAF